MEWIIIIGYSVALAGITFFSIEQLYLALVYRKVNSIKKFSPLDTFPSVTIQLPIYNEKYVVKRLIDCMCQLDYPKDKLEIQVLDDSTDETSEIIAAKVLEWTNHGFEIQHIRRKDRVGYKAGALEYGLQSAKGEFIAIFDADFLPKANFLNETLPAFDDHIGMVQTRWGHINKNFSLLTRLQAFGLNAHFTVEQTGKNAKDVFITFDGTAGIWRKSCIEEAGGWEHDTLTEDLDLSYRAQLKGWKFLYLEQVVAPAELPVLISAVKSQQYRWNKGAAETAKKTAKRLIKSDQPFRVKLHGLMRLFNSSIYLFLVMASTLSIPLLFLKTLNPDISIVVDMTSVFFIGFLGMMFFYWISVKSVGEKASFSYYFSHFPLFLMFSMGMALHNAIAVMEGYLGKKSPFVRTPKFNVKTKSDHWEGNKYLTVKLSPVTILEGLLAFYFLFGAFSGIYLEDFALLFFHLMLAGGFGAVFFLSVKSLIYVPSRK